VRSSATRQPCGESGQGDEDRRANFLRWGCWPSAWRSYRSSRRSMGAAPSFALTLRGGTISLRHRRRWRDSRSATSFRGRPTGRGNAYLGRVCGSRGPEPTTIFDFAIRVLKDRVGSGRAISVVHSDLPGNDFSALFQTLANDSDSHLRADPAAFASALGRLFYRPQRTNATLHAALQLDPSDGDIDKERSHRGRSVRAAIRLDPNIRIPCSCS
jgi:hypothetical protein